MIRNVKILSVILTLFLLFLVFWGVYEGTAFSLLFWLMYIALALIDWQCIQWLKKNQR
ncbi:MAG: hypothetical protein U9N81_08325 [Bacillota bacterium]|nr:hypothetical protein [Bacillota bacterium]